MTYDEKIKQMYAQGLDKEQILDIVLAHMASIKGRENDIEDFNDYDIPVKPEVEIDGTSTLKKAAQASVEEAKQRKAEKAAATRELGVHAYDFANDPKFSFDYGNEDVEALLDDLSVGEYNTLKNLAIDVLKGQDTDIPDTDKGIFSAIDADTLRGLVDSAIKTASPRQDLTKLADRNIPLAKLGTKETFDAYKSKKTGKYHFKPKAGFKNISKAAIAKNPKSVLDQLAKDPDRFIKNDPSIAEAIDNAQMAKFGYTRGSEHTSAPWAVRWHDYAADAMNDPLMQNERIRRMRLAKQLGPILQAAQRRF